MKIHSADPRCSDHFVVISASALSDMVRPYRSPNPIPESSFLRANDANQSFRVMEFGAPLSYSPATFSPRPSPESTMKREPATTPNALACRSDCVESDQSAQPGLSVKPGSSVKPEPSTKPDPTIKLEFSEDTIWCNELSKPEQHIERNYLEKRDIVGRNMAIVWGIHQIDSPGDIAGCGIWVTDWVITALNNSI